MTFVDAWLFAGARTRRMQECAGFSSSPVVILYLRFSPFTESFKDSGCHAYDPNNEHKAEHKISLQ